MNEFKEWQNKFNSLPRLPRSKSKFGYIDSLKVIFSHILKGSKQDSVIKFDGSETSNTLKHYTDILSRYQILNSDSEGNYFIRDEFINFQDESFQEKVAEFLSLNIKYMSEMLEFLITPRTSKEILVDAKTNYNMTWKQKGQIHERISWLSDLGLINAMSYKQLYVISDEGKKFIKKNRPVKPIIISKYIQDVTEGEKDIKLSDWINRSEWFENFKEKKDTLGFIPGGRSNATALILDILGYAREVQNIESIIYYINNIFKCKDSSINSFMTFLTNLKVIDRIGEKVYKTSNYGDKLLNSNMPDLELLFLMNKEYKYIFEILLVLEEMPQEPKELAIRGVTEFNMNSESLERIRERIIHLKNAKLILNDKGKKLKLSRRGKKLCFILREKINLDRDKGEITEKILDKEQKDYQYLLKEARLASTDSSNPQAFEIALEKIFKELGFKTNLLAKAGTTDILLTAPTAPKHTYKVAVEVKTNREGKIKENSINFDALKEHKVKHNADFIVVIGKTFYGERLKKFAENNNVLLINMKALESLVKKHQIYPLQAIEYKKLFSQVGEVDINIFESTYNDMHKRNILFKSIIQALIDNSDDDFTQGILTMREIYILIKDKEEFITDHLTKEEVTNMLNLLSNPLIGCVGIEGNGYYAKGSLIDAQLKFGFYYHASIK